MALQKTIAGYFDKDGSWIEQQHIDMHELEEAAIRAHWNIHDVKADLPQYLALHEEHNLMINEGIEAVQAKRNEVKAAHDDRYSIIQEAIVKAEEAHRIWEEHASLCVANGFDPNTYPGNAKDTLPPPLPLKNPEGEENAIN